MSENLYQDKNLDERREMLEATADDKIFAPYERQFSNQEIEKFHEKLSDIVIEIQKIETEKANTSKVFNDKLKPLKKELRDIADNIRFRGRMVEEIVYKFVDHDANKVSLYTIEGICVSSRPLKFDEQQRSIMSEIRNNGQDDEETVDIEHEEEQEDWDKVEK
ncbi:MAG: hypothetical protein ACW964_13685 [Candidatus Hodarchaeales archaeon]|jgi:hypothetical protein